MKIDMAGLPSVVTPFQTLQHPRSPGQVRMGRRAGERAVRGTQPLVGPHQERDEVGRGRPGVVLVVDGADRVLDALQVVDGDLGAGLAAAG